MNLREPFTFNMAPAFAALMDRPDRRAPRRVPRSGVAASGARGPRDQDDDPTELGCARGRGVRRDPELDRPAGRRPRGRAATAPRSTSMIDISLAEDLDTRFRSVLANNDPDAIAWLLQQDGCLLGLADSGAHVSQLCDACLPDRPARELGPREGGHHPRARGPQADRRAGGRLRARPRRAAAAAASRSAWPPTSPCSTPTPSRPGPLRRIRDFPADGERLTADQPSGMRHTLVNGVPVRTDGVPDCRGSGEPSPASSSEADPRASRYPDRMKRALVTGATGFVGRALTRRLVADGWSVDALVRRPDADVPVDVERHLVPGRRSATSSTRGRDRRPHALLPPRDRVPRRPSADGHRADDRGQPRLRHEPRRSGRARVPACIS